MWCWPICSDSWWISFVNNRLRSWFGCRCVLVVRIEKSIIYISKLLVQSQLQEVDGDEKNNSRRTRQNRKTQQKNIAQRSEWCVFNITIERVNTSRLSNLLFSCVFSFSFCLVDLFCLLLLLTLASWKFPRRALRWLLDKKNTQHVSVAGGIKTPRVAFVLQSNTTSR